MSSDLVKGFKHLKSVHSLHKQAWHGDAGHSVLARTTDPWHRPLHHGITRRGFLGRVGAAAAGLLMAPTAEAFSRALSQERKLTLFNANTQEELCFSCSPQQQYDHKLLTQFNHFLRDHRTERSHNMDPALLDLLYAITVLTRGRGEFRIISGFRAPETNYMLRKQGHGVAEHSLHMAGKAIDLRSDELSTESLREAAMALQWGGVGYYASADFLHMDTGDIRYW
jgi:uncharacterized protein YcbK (DUF882 family)